MELIDSHCHIHFDSYPLDRRKAIQDAAEVGVTRMVCVGCSIEDSQKAVDFTAQHANVWATAGAHPHDGADYLREKKSGEKLRKLLTHPKVIAIGEIGLDYYHTHSTKEDQEKSLREQIEVGLEFNKPFVFHVRDAWDDFWRIYDSFPGLKGVVHSFTAHRPQLEQVLSRGLYVSLNGIMTFTKDEQQLEAAKSVPLDKLLLETDAPFLTPKPYRGKTCEPKHVLDTAKFLAELRGESLEELAGASTKNALALFRIS